MNAPESFDVAVIGGGAAGLSAALVLGRARRRVVVVDAGTPRNAPVEHAQLVRQWSHDVVFFVHTYDVSAEERAGLAARGIDVVEGEVARLVVDRDVLTGVELADGRVVERAAVFIRPGLGPRRDG